MKAAVHTRYGPPDVVRVVDVPTPVPKDNEVLVKVHATTVNRTDCGFRGAKPFFIRAFSGLVRPRVTILGNEFAGQIQAIGAAVTSFAVGDRVFGYDDTAFGAHAQYLAIHEDASLALLPADSTYEQAAPATEGSHYALANIRKAKIRAGQRVLVNGATGAIGSAAVQLLASRGVHVTAVCDTPHLELVQKSPMREFSDAWTSLNDRLAKPISPTPARTHASMTFWCCCTRRWGSLPATSRTRSTPTSARSRAGESS